MSIPAQGRRSVLFPPPGVKIRRTIETQALTDSPTLIAEHDSARILLIVLLDYTIGSTVNFAGSLIGLSTGVGSSGNNGKQLCFWGAEEVWAQCVYPATAPFGNLLCQSVFYD